MLKVVVVEVRGSERRCHFKFDACWSKPLKEWWGFEVWARGVVLGGGLCVDKITSAREYDDNYCTAPVDYNASLVLCLRMRRFVIMVIVIIVLRAEGEVGSAGYAGLI